MNEKEKEILDTIAEALPEMSEGDKRELLGYGRAMVDIKKEKEKPNRERRKSWSLSIWQ